MRGHSRHAGMDCINHWIPRPSFQTPLYHLGGLFPTLLYHLHPCRRACAGMTAGGHYRRFVIPAKAGIQEGRVGMWHGLRASLGPLESPLMSIPAMREWFT